MLHDWMFAEATEEDRAILQDMLDGVGDTPCFVVTHTRPRRQHPSVFTFVTAGVADAIEQAEQAAGEKVVGLHGASVMQQALPLGLVDEIRVHVIPVLLGGGTPLFASLSSAIGLERTRVRVTPAATHLEFRVLPPSPSA
jgi:dihydrofolate reductase